MLWISGKIDDPFKGMNARLKDRALRDPGVALPRKNIHVITCINHQNFVVFLKERAFFTTIIKKIGPES